MKCLIVADDPVIGFMVEQATAQAGCESRTFAVPADALAVALEDAGACLAIIDHVPPRADGAAWCAALRSGEERRTLRVILLAPPDDPFDLRRMADVGLDDLLVKPFQAVELELRLQANLRIIELEAQVDAGTRALHAEATHDLLTGTLNGKAIGEALRQECDRASRDRAPLAAIHVEVDDLGTVRDWTGAEAAEAVLVEVAARIRGSLRPYDSLGRSGDAGFLVGLPKCDLTHAVSVAQRILAAVAAAPVKGAGRMVSVTASIGVACLESAAADGSERLEAAAASALSSARATGGNRVATPPGSPFA